MRFNLYIREGLKNCDCLPNYVLVFLSFDEILNCIGIPNYVLVFLSFDEILNLIESVSEDFPSYSCISELLCLCCVEIVKNLPAHSFNALIIPILRDCLPNYVLVFLSFDEILNLIESVSEDFPSYSYILNRCSCSEISDSDCPTCIPLSVKWTIQFMALANTSRKLL